MIDCYLESSPSYDGDYAIVAIDVIRATTTAVTGVARGRKCFPVSSLEAAWNLAAKLPNPLMVGELEGYMPPDFDINNSPFELDARDDLHRPMILLSTSGTKLICLYEGHGPVYVACLRNYTAQAAHLVREHEKIALIGAGSRGEFRKEDVLCCARIARCLLESGYQPSGERTKAIVNQWGQASIEEIATGKSAQYLLDSGQEKDLEFILAHIDDLDEVYHFAQGQVQALPTPHRLRRDGEINESQGSLRGTGRAFY